MTGSGEKQVTSDEHMGTCRRIEHTADIGIRCRASTLERLFACAARAMFEIIVPGGEVKPTDTVRVTVEAVSLEELLVRWLEEVLYIWESRRMLVSRFSISTVSPEGLEAEVAGETYDATRHELHTEIKAATYHGLRVERKGDVWEAQVIFDV
jgi:SHS2 domain-containing protein